MAEPGDEAVLWSGRLQVVERLHPGTCADFGGRPTIPAGRPSYHCVWLRHDCTMEELALGARGAGAASPRRPGATAVRACGGHRRDGRLAALQIRARCADDRTWPYR